MSNLAEFRVAPHQALVGNLNLGKAVLAINGAGASPSECLWQHRANPKPIEPDDKRKQVVSQSVGHLLLCRTL